MKFWLLQDKVEKKRDKVLRPTMQTSNIVQIYLVSLNILLNSNFDITPMTAIIQHPIEKKCVSTKFLATELTQFEIWSFKFQISNFKFQIWKGEK